MTRSFFTSFQLNRYQYIISTEHDSPRIRALLTSITNDQARFKQTLKTDGTTTVSLLNFENTPLVIKRYNTKNTWHLLRRFFRTSRADNCWEMSKLFLNAGIKVPKRVATIQERLGPLKLRSWFISEFIPAQDLLDYFRSAENESHHFERIKPQLNALFAALLHHKISHGDMKATNILLDEELTLTLIDLDAAKQHSNPARFNRAHHKDRLRFFKNWENNFDLYSKFKSLSFNPITHSNPKL